MTESAFTPQGYPGPSGEDSQLSALEQELLVLLERRRQLIEAANTAAELTEDDALEYVNDLYDQAAEAQKDVEAFIGEHPEFAEDPDGE